MRPQGASGRLGDPLGDPTAALRRGVTISGLARQLDTRVEHRVEPHHTGSSKLHSMTQPVLRG